MFFIYCSYALIARKWKLENTVFGPRYGILKGCYITTYRPDKKQACSNCKLLLTQMTLSVRSICWISVCSEGIPPGGGPLQSLQACCQSALLMPMPPPAYWLIAGWTSPWLMWQTIGLVLQPPKTHTHTPTHTRTPFHKGEPSTDSECEWWLYFHCNKTRDWLKTFRVGVYPTGQLASAADWCNWSRDEKRLFAPKDILVMNSSCNRAFREWDREQLSAHFKVHACCCIWTPTKQPHFVSPNVSECIRIVPVSVGWWIVKECALNLIQGPLYNSLLELLLACQSHCVHIHVDMSTSFIQGVRSFSDPLLKLCYLVEPGHGCDSFHSLFSQADRQGGGLLLSPRRKTTDQSLRWCEPLIPACIMEFCQGIFSRRGNFKGLKLTRATSILRCFLCRLKLKRS